MSEQQRTRTVYRLPPCPLYDVERMESWLRDMARQGLFLEEKGLAWGLAHFQQGEPRDVEYRLVSRQKTRRLWKLLLWPDPERFDGPKEEEVDLFAQFGWVYLSRCSNFFVYRAEGEQVLEVDSDPKVQAISIQAVRDVEVVLALSMGLMLVFDFFLFFRGSMSYLIAEGYFPYVLGIMALPVWLAVLFFLQALAMDRLRRRLSRGEALDHRKPWRPARAAHLWKGPGLSAFGALPRGGLCRRLDRSLLVRQTPPTRSRRNLGTRPLPPWPTCRRKENTSRILKPTADLPRSAVLFCKKSIETGGTIKNKLRMKDFPLGDTELSIKKGRSHHGTTQQGRNQWGKHLQAPRAHPGGGQGPLSGGPGGQ